jgi:hypothetical protein
MVRNQVSGTEALQSIQGAVPYSATQFFGPGLTSAAASSFAGLTLIAGSEFFIAQSGSDPRNSQNQTEVTSSVSTVHFRHTIKAGVDWRFLRPNNDLLPTFSATVRSLQSVMAGVVDTLNVGVGPSLRTASTQVSAYAQDEWRVSANLVLTWGARWDVNPAPYARNGLQPITLTNFTDLSQTQVVIAKTLYPTIYNKVAPRLGLAWKKRGIVVRGGLGLFNDLGFTSSASVFSGYPYVFTYPFSNLTLPLSIPTLQLSGPASVSAPYPSLTAVNPRFSLPKVVEWNLTAEKAVTQRDAVSASYIGSSGSDLSSDNHYVVPSKLFTGSVDIIDSQGTSSYEALQVKYERRLSHGLQILASHTWSHAIDTVSNESLNTLEKGSAAFDIRHLTSFAFVAELPQKSRLSLVTKDLQLFLMARIQSGPPLDITATGLELDAVGRSVVRRPDRVAGVPVWIDDGNVPGGRKLNPLAFSAPPAGVQGNLGRDAVTGLGLSQFDAAASKTIFRRDRFRVALRIDAFNVFNHPNFAQSTRLGLGLANFGISQSMLNNTGTVVPGASLSSPFRIGGPRALQLSARIYF